jgi:hypothetical protein
VLNYSKRVIFQIEMLLVWVEGWFAIWMQNLTFNLKYSNSTSL